MVKDKYNAFIMDENSADNPFGPNYFKLPYMAKVAYKYNKMKGYIEPTNEDVIHKQYEEGKFLGTLVLGFTSGVYIAEGIRK